MHYERIVHLSFGYEFPWDSIRALEIALYRTYCVPGISALLRSLLQLRGRAVRWLPPRKTAHFFTDNRNRTHPDGYEISGLGPPQMVAAAEKRAKSEV